MSLQFIDINDFIGEINLDLSSDNNVQAQFEALGNQVINDILLDLFNDKLYNDFYADLSNGVPQTQKFIYLLDGKTYIRISGETKKYEGLKRMLRYFVYDAYLEFTHTQNISTGQATNQNENSVIISRSQLRKVRANIQNKAVNLYNRAILFINDNYTDYFSGSDYSFWSPIKKRYLGKITSTTYNNTYFFNRSSEGN